MPEVIEFDKKSAREIRRAYEKERLSLRGVAEEFGVSVPVIRRTIESAGGEIRGRGRQAGKAY